MSHLYWLQAISLSPPQLPNPINFSPKPTHTHTHILKSVSSFLLSSSRTSLFLSFSLHIHINTSHSPFSSAFSQSRWLRCPHTHSPTHLLWSLHPVLPLPSRNRTPLKKHTSAARLRHSHYHSNIYIATARLTPQSEKKKYTQPLFGYQTWRCIRNERCSVPAICLWFCNGFFFFYTVTFTGHSSPRFCVNHLRSYNQNTYIHVLAVLSYNYSCQCSLHSAIAAHVTETT